MELTILMPCLDEAATVGRCVEKARAFLRRARVEGEVLVADNGSRDDSRMLAERAGARVIEVRQRGYGAALAAGIAAAGGRFVIMGDADDSYDFARLEGFVEKLRQGYPWLWATASRAVSGRGRCPRCIATWETRC
jgi:glycosyltransferase involved in cell wall biosynthesis